MKIAITGLGTTCASGTSTAALMSSILSGQGAVRALNDVPEFGLTRAAAAICTDDLTIPSIAKHLLLDIDRVSLFSLHAAEQAIAQSESRHAAPLQRDSVAILWGCSMGGLSTLDAGYLDVLVRGKKRIRPTTVPMSMPSAPAFHVAHHFGLKGPVSTISAACASSALAIGQACKMIDRGEAQQMLVGGVDSMVAPTVLRAWQASGALASAHLGDPRLSCKPFDAQRQGFVMGDGAAALMLESEASARARKAEILGWVRGFGHTSDISHISRPGAASQAAAMRAALQDAGVRSVEEVGYVNAHGTATLVGDAVEAASIKDVFENYASRLPISSTKPLHGHLLGGAGALEAVITLLSLKEGMLPANANLENLSEDCAHLNVLREPTRIAKGALALSNSFAFGGINSALVLEAAFR
jgi:3-oxoacyl-[acyl-carrier-protein] synthase II